MYKDTDASKRRGVSFTWEDVGNASGQFQCFINFKGPLAPEHMTFPREDCGFVAIDTKGTHGAPSFSKKKDARRYAAQSCVHWLLRQGEVVNFPKIGTPKNKAPTPSPAPLAARAVAAAPTTAAPPANKEVIKTNWYDSSEGRETSDKDEDDIPVTKRVIQLCQELRYEVPAYSIHPSSKGPEGFYDGIANFGRDSLSVPDGLGYDRSCFGKEGTKQRIAEEVVKWLLGVKTERNKKLAALEADLAGGANGGVKVE